MNALIAALMAAAIWVALTPPSRNRLRRLMNPPAMKSKPQLPMPLIAAVSLAVGVVMIIGSTLGLLLGLGSGFIAFRLFGRLESRSDRERSQALSAQMPIVCDLLAATLASGASMTSAVDAVRHAVGEPAAQTLARVDRALVLGTPMAQVWSTAHAEPAFARIAAAFERSSQSGAPVAELLIGVASDERRTKRRTVEVAARGAGVRSVMPLAACYLPAFMLMGVIPVVASMATSLFNN